MMFQYLTKEQFLTLMFKKIRQALQTHNMVNDTTLSSAKTGIVELIHVTNYW